MHLTHTWLDLSPLHNYRWVNNTSWRSDMKEQESHYLEDSCMHPSPALWTAREISWSKLSGEVWCLPAEENNTETWGCRRTCAASQFRLNAVSSVKEQMTAGSGEKYEFFLNVCVCATATILRFIVCSSLVFPHSLKSLGFLSLFPPRYAHTPTDWQHTHTGAQQGTLIAQQMMNDLCRLNLDRLCFINASNFMNILTFSIVFAQM